MSMKLAELVEKIKQETDVAKVGMIACHNGVVRGTTRDGIQAEYLEISVDASAMHKVLEDMRREPGIAAVEAYIHTGRRNIGDDVMLVAVAGDIRENVFPVLERTVNRLKSEAVHKMEKTVVEA
ncbi:MAG: molybdenum cofactor biosynthesis protein MoaE [Syntrophobacteraceae bacterium]|nr:molybdenum cofactor biosynthesis protein MoaE [Syntrophobacteraceae bacterium]